MGHPAGAEVINAIVAGYEVHEAIELLADAERDCLATSGLLPFYSYTHPYSPQPRSRLVFASGYSSFTTSFSASVSRRHMSRWRP
jgi:hypothetical protein